MTWLTVLELAIKITVVLLFITVTVLVLTYLERKVLGRIQNRLGPMRTGPWGIMQPIADAIKLLVKEDLMPTMTDKVVFWLAPLVVFVPAFLIWVTIPFTQDLVVRHLDLGVFYIIAVSVVSIVGMVMAGWGSANKYALLGGARAAAQLISYELPLIVVFLGVAMMAQSLNLKEIVALQDPWPYALIQPLGFFIFFMAGLAEVSRIPFDIPHAESEVMGGPFIEYSGMHWAMFFLAEYANTFAIAALTVLLFLGGWNGPILPPIVWFMLKCYAIILVIFWMRATLPRFRIDQLMAFAWKVLLPVSFLNILIVAFYVYYRWPIALASLLSLLATVVMGYAIYKSQRKAITYYLMAGAHARRRSLA